MTGLCEFDWVVQNHFVAHVAALKQEVQQHDYLQSHNGMGGRSICLFNDFEKGLSVFFGAAVEKAEQTAPVKQIAAFGILAGDIELAQHVGTLVGGQKAYKAEHRTNTIEYYK